MSKRTLALPWMLLSMTLCLAACGGGDSGEGATPDPDQGPPPGDAQHRDAERDDAGPADLGGPVGVGPEIDVSPLTVVLVARAGMSSEAGEVRVRNDGTAPLDLTRVAIDPADAPFVVDPAGPSTLAPGESVSLQVTYTAPDAGMHTAALVLESNDQDEAVITVNLQGREPRECVEVSPRRLDLGAVELGVPSGRFELTARNCGDSVVHLPSVTVEGEPQFHLAQGQNEAPLSDLSLEPGRTLRFDVWYVNEALGQGQTADATIRLETDVPSDPLIEVPVHVAGTEAARCTPQFDPARLEFGPLRIGTTAELPIRVTNLGNTACQVLDLRVTHEDGNAANTFAISGDGATLEALAPGETHEMTIVFAPTVRDQQGNRDALEIVFTEEGNELNRREKAFLFGVAAIAELGAVSESVTFSVTQSPDCASTTRDVDIQNIGLVPLCITGTRMEGDDCGAFVRLEGPEESDCLTLASAEVATWRYQFEPTRLGEHSCDFVATGDAMNVPEVHTRLLATAVDTAAQEDEWDVGRLNAQQRAYFALSRPAESDSISVELEGAPNEDWHFSNMRNAVYFEPADHPDMGDHLVVRYDARCLDRSGP